MKNCCTVQDHRTKTPDRRPGQTGKDRRKLSGSTKLENVPQPEHRIKLAYVLDRINRNTIGQSENENPDQKVPQPEHKIRLAQELDRITPNTTDQKEKAPRSAWAASHTGQQCSER